MSTTDWTQPAPNQRATSGAACQSNDDTRPCRTDGGAVLILLLGGLTALGPLSVQFTLTGMLIAMTYS